MDYTTLTEDRLDSLINEDSANVDLLLSRAMIYYKSSQLHKAYNDFVRVLMIDQNNNVAQQYIEMLKLSMNFEYRENYNV